MPEFADWDSFYVIVGSAAGALVGLQFVAMTLIGERPHKDLALAGAAFSTPTIVHFGAVLFLAALLRAPWHTVGMAANVWGALGLGGTGYAAIVTRRIRRQSAYRPVFEDWLFHAALPGAAYVGLAVSSGFARLHAREALFGVGGASLLLLFSAIHNAWDAVRYHVTERRLDGGPRP